MYRMQLFDSNGSLAYDSFDKKKEKTLRYSVMREVVEMKSGSVKMENGTIFVPPFRAVVSTEKKMPKKVPKIDLPTGGFRGNQII